MQLNGEIAMVLEKIDTYMGKNFYSMQKKLFGDDHGSKCKK